MDRRPLAFAAACAGLATAVYVVVVHVALVQRLDLHVLEDAMRHRTEQRTTVASDLVGLFDPAPFAVITASLVAGALLAGRVRAGFAAGGAMLAAAVTTQLLKPALAVQRPYPADHYMPAASWPSGHTTAIVSLLLAFVIVLPPRLRPPVAVLGGGIAALALGSIVLLGFHYPSDVLGGVLVASGWSAVALAVSGSGRAPTAARRRPRSHPATG
ncbi:phosphatase PAP2 family protein [Candidatus Solirubrobacter pratensis]|uniref:phosphatase PAP2 family protein n=1 Tax=Candidatus Solirubrobacter pratensis TaxID=1298857 RepID=UPI0006847D4A|nr:phosphatase PAP2 family protein [Candidatus Solirubrobacter pratensis]